MAVSWGILGCANIAEKFCTAIAESGNARVAAVASRSHSKALDFAAKHCRAAKAYGSYEELLQDTSIQAVYIPVPTGLRTEIALKAAAAGKHILVEKPLVNKQELQSMVDACKSSGVQFMDNTMFMHHNRQAAMHDVLEDTTFFSSGAKHVTATFSIPFGLQDAWAAENIRMQKDLEPLGCLGDLGWYCVRFALWAFDYAEPCSISCSFLEQTPEGVPTHALGQMRFEGGRTASIMCSFRAALYQSAEVVGDSCVLQLDDFVIPARKDSASFKVTKMGIGDKALTFPTEVVKQQTVFGCVQHTELVKTFSSLVAAGKLDETWPRRSLQTQAVLDAMVDSARQDGAWQKFSAEPSGCALQ